MKKEALSFLSVVNIAQKKVLTWTNGCIKVSHWGSSRNQVVDVYSRTCVTKTFLYSRILHQKTKVMICYISMVQECSISLSLFVKILYHKLMFCFQFYNVDNHLLHQIYQWINLMYFDVVKSKEREMKLFVLCFCISNRI